MQSCCLPSLDLWRSVDSLTKARQSPLPEMKKKKFQKFSKAEARRSGMVNNLQSAITWTQSELHCLMPLTLHENGVQEQKVCMICWALVLFRRMSFPSARERVWVFVSDGAPPVFVQAGAV